jgi:hypothetical protein
MSTMQNRLSALITLLLCSISTAMAADWSSIIKNKDAEILVDIDSYNVAGKTPYIIAKTIFVMPQTYSSNNKIIQYSTSIKQMRFNCSEATYKTESIALYDKKNKFLMSEKLVTNFKKIEANSTEFSIGQLTCQVHQMLGGQ